MGGAGVVVELRERAGAGNGEGRGAAGGAAGEHEACPGGGADDAGLGAVRLLLMAAATSFRVRLPDPIAMVSLLPPAVKTSEPLPPASVAAPEPSRFE